MSTSLDFIDFVRAQADGAGDLSYRQMFGEYILYCDRRPVFLVCDNTVFVKKIPAALDVFSAHGIEPDTSLPYDGASMHYVLDIENKDLARDMAQTLATVLPIPRARKPKAKSKQ